MKQNTQHVVTKKAMRPGSNEPRCFYCHQRIGETHLFACELIKKRAKIRMTVEYEIEIPESWGKDDVEFHRNSGTWCANNAIQELKNAFEQGGETCMCGRADFQYLGDESEAYLNERGSRHEN